MSVKLASLISPEKKVIVKRYTWNIRGREDYLCIGSIITWMTSKRSVIWGSGVVYPNKELSAIPKKIYAVRGPLTREYLLQRGINCPEIYGDPALLFPQYYMPNPQKKYKLGIIPHFRDKQNQLLGKFKNDESVLIIDVQNIHPWHKFIDDIYSCECIASSSLHGIIISDAYNVPNVWIEFEEGERKEFAFNDYLLSVKKNNVKPLLINANTEKNDLIKESQKWTPIRIDLENLINVCPFK
jgi:pyruvyltransferase